MASCHRLLRGLPQLSVNCISAAPAALDRYLAALPAMSLTPFAPLLLVIEGTPSPSAFVLLRRDKHSSPEQGRGRKGVRRDATERWIGRFPGEADNSAVFDRVELHSPS